MFVTSESDYELCSVDEQFQEKNNKKRNRGVSFANVEMLSQKQTSGSELDSLWVDPSSRNSMQSVPSIPSTGSLASDSSYGATDVTLHCFSKSDIALSFGKNLHLIPMAVKKEFTS